MSKHVNMSDVYIYLFEGSEDLHEDYINFYIKLLPEKRYKKCLRYKNPNDRANCILSYFILRDALKERYSYINYRDFRYNKQGKPYLADNNDIFFSISHTKNVVAVAVSNYEVGIDVERLRDVGDDLINMIASPLEKERVLASDDSQREFFRLWTMKESYAKAYGMSVTELLKKDVETSGYVHLDGIDFAVTSYLGRYDNNLQNKDKGFTPTFTILTEQGEEIC